MGSYKKKFQELLVFFIFVKGKRNFNISTCLVSCNLNLALQSHQPFLFFFLVEFMLDPPLGFVIPFVDE